MVGRQHVHGSRGIWNKGVNPKRKPSVNSAMELDCHRTQKKRRDAARANPGGKPKQKNNTRMTKDQQRAHNAALRSAREAPPNVIVENRIGGKLVSTRTIKRRPMKRK